jgi:hypothetical protein
MFSPCSELGIYMYLTGNSINNLLSYCVKASDIDLPALLLNEGIPRAYRGKKLRLKNILSLPFIFDSF